MEPSRKSKQHLPVLDGLRGLAILAVIVCHVNHSFGGPWMPGAMSGPMARIFGWSWVGVDLFFVLSGFLITGILFDTKNDAGFLQNFYARRALRIMPLYYGFILLVIVLNRLHWLTASWISVDRLFSLASYTYNFRVGLTGQGIGGFHHFWSLAVEEHFYLVWPLIVGYFQRRLLMRLCLTIAAASFLLRCSVVASGVVPPLAGFFLTPCRVDGLLAGSFLALAWRSEAEWAFLRRNAAMALLACGGMLLGLAVGQGHFLPDVDQRLVGHEAAVGSNLVITAGVALLAIFFASLVVIAIEAPPSGALKRTLESTWLRALGKYSYGIYVFHPLLLIGTVAAVQDWGPVPSVVTKLLGVVWVTGASFGVAWLSYHLFEVHFLRLKGHFEGNKNLALESPISSVTQVNQT